MADEQTIEFKCNATGKQARLIMGGVDMTEYVSFIRIEAGPRRATQVWVKLRPQRIKTELVAAQWLRYEAEPEPATKDDAE